MISETSGARALRILSGVLCSLVTFDLLLLVVTGNSVSILAPGRMTSPAAFAAREAVLAVALVTRFRLLALPEKRLSVGQLMLALAVFPALFHFQVIGRRITGDALYYYVFTHSMMRDGDVDLANQYTHYGLIERNDFSVPTGTGYRRSIYSIGPGLLWTPFFVAADGLAAGLGALGFEVDTSGYGPLHINTAALGSFAYGIAGLFLIHAFLKRHFGDRLAGGTVLLLWWASFFEWYLAEQPLTSHPASVFLIAAFFLLRQRKALATPAGSLGVGLILGLGMSVRWQNGVFLLLPALDLLSAWLRGEAAKRIAARGVAISAGVVTGVMPQLLAWKAIYGVYLLPYPPQGPDFLRLDRPFLLNTLFSSRHGLLSWTPVFWLCLIGLVPLTRKDPRRFMILWAPVLIMTYVNACVGDWWAGGSFSNRRFDSLFPVFALGLAAFLESARAFVKRRPSSVATALVLGGAVWSLTFVRAASNDEAGKPETLTLDARALASARELSRTVGFPTTWPASWIFAARYDASPGAFDLAAGKYLFYRQNNLQGIADVGGEDDEGLIVDGFSAPRRDGTVTSRRIETEARMIVSLDLPEELATWFRARTTGSPAAQLAVRINGRDAGSFMVGDSWDLAPLIVPDRIWVRGPNVISLRTSSPIDLDRVTFKRKDR